MELTPQEVAERVEAGDVDLVDVREPYEFEAGRIEGSRHVPLPELAEFAQTLDPQRPLVFVCRVGGRSAMATDAFRGAGFEAYNLAGGVLAWERSGLPFTGSVADH
jgi:rhodanese-related sulfurtransferase